MLISVGEVIHIIKLCLIICTSTKLRFLPYTVTSAPRNPMVSSDFHWQLYSCAHSYTHTELKINLNKGGGLDTVQE